VAIGLAVPGARAGEPDAKGRLDALVTEAWELEKAENPLRATATGDHRFNDRLPSTTIADLERRAAAARAQLARLQGIACATLAEQDRISYEMFERGLREDLARHHFRSWRIPITSDSGVFTVSSLRPRHSAASLVLPRPPSA